MLNQRLQSVQTDKAPAITQGSYQTCRLPSRNIARPIPKFRCASSGNLGTKVLHPKPFFLLPASEGFRVAGKELDLSYQNMGYIADNRVAGQELDLSDYKMGIL